MLASSLSLAQALIHSGAGVWMTLMAYAVVLTVALPYWAMVGEPLRLSPAP